MPLQCYVNVILRSLYFNFFHYFTNHNKFIILAFFHFKTHFLPSLKNLTKTLRTSPIKIFNFVMFDLFNIIKKALTNTTIKTIQVTVKMEGNYDVHLEVCYYSCCYLVNYLLIIIWNIHVCVYMYICIFFIFYLCCWKVSDTSTFKDIKDYSKAQGMNWCEVDKCKVYYRGMVLLLLLLILLFLILFYFFLWRNLPFWFINTSRSWCFFRSNFKTFTGRCYTTFFWWNHSLCLFDELVD
jgi:hypothetical protein